MNKDRFICRVLSIQRRKHISFLYVSGFRARQLMIDNTLLAEHAIGIMSIVRGSCREDVNDRGAPVCRITEIDSVVHSGHSKAYHKCFTGEAVRLRLCRNEILNQVRAYLQSEQFQCISSPFTLPYRGTSIASPLRLTGKYVDQYCKITHEFFLKKEAAENLVPVYEIGYVARDVYPTVAGWFEYAVLEFVSPLHDMDFIEAFIRAFIRIAVDTARAYGVKFCDVSGMQTITLDENGCWGGKTFQQLKAENSNVLFLNAPVNSPLVKQIDGRRTETIWFFNHESMAHGYRDENSWDALYQLSTAQLEQLRAKGIEAEYSRDFLSLLKLGVPESVSIGFGIDRFFQVFFGFRNMRDYREIMCHSGEY